MDVDEFPAIEIRAITLTKRCNAAARFPAKAANASMTFAINAKLRTPAPRTIPARNVAVRACVELIVILL